MIPFSKQSLKNTKSAARRLRFIDFLFLYLVYQLETGKRNIQNDFICC